ncbi:unnamed protein product, partial [Nesidiocoris tenuis]
MIEDEPFIVSKQNSGEGTRSKNCYPTLLTIITCWNTNVPFPAVRTNGPCTGEFYFLIFEPDRIVSVGDEPFISSVQSRAGVNLWSTFVLYLQHDYSHYLIFFCFAVDFYRLNRDSDKVPKSDK